MHVPRINRCSGATGRGSQKKCLLSARDLRQRIALVQRGSVLNSGDRRDRASHFRDDLVRGRESVSLVFKRFAGVRYQSSQAAFALGENTLVGIRPGRVVFAHFRDGEVATQLLSSRVEPKATCHAVCQVADDACTVPVGLAVRRYGTCTPFVFVESGVQHAEFEHLATTQYGGLP